MRELLTALFFLLCVLDFNAQGSITATVDRNPVALGERFRYTITLENAKGSLIAPDFKGFRIVAGPQTASSTSIINGQVSSSLSHTYFLTPLNKGTLTISPAKANTQSGELVSNSIEMEITEGSAAAAGHHAQPKATANTNAELFIRIYADKVKAVRGEQVIVSYVLYNRYRGFEMVGSEMPPLKGFWKEEVKVENPRWEDKNEVINGRPYQKAVLARQVLFPQKSGELEIGPFKMDARIGRSFFNQGRELEVRSNTVKLDVSPLPSAPSGFKGAVGSFDMNVKFDKTTVQTNEPINLVIKISGSGNLKLINEPDIDFPSDFEVYEPKTSDRISTNAGGVRGSRTFEYLIIPRYPGTYDLDAIEFSFYDPKQKKFRKRNSEAISIEVERSGTEGEGAGNTIIRKEDVAILDKDIRHIATSSPTWTENDSYFSGSLGHMAGVGLPLFMALGLLIFRRKQLEAEADVVGMKKKKASKVANRRLSQAKSHMSGSDDVFFSTLNEAIDLYLCDTLNIGSSDLRTDLLKKELASAGISDEIGQNIDSFRADCQMARYSSMGNIDRHDMLMRAESIINRLEEEV